ncbi:MAG: hypothetical protein JKY41_04255 [Rhodobacteraceae bacterium]|nr:hypothetical protein [Paracoccaceae bacterium]
MMIARWQFTAKFGYKDKAIELIKEWETEIGSQTNIDVANSRMATGSVGVSEGLVENELYIEGLDDLQQFFDKIATVEMHKDWGRSMGEVIVDGSTRWEVFRIV